MAAVRRALRTVPVELGRTFLQLSLWRPVQRLGLAPPLRALDRLGRRRALDSAWHSRNAGLPGVGKEQQGREDADRGSFQTTAEGDHSLGLRAHGRAGAVLYL